MSVTIHNVNYYLMFNSFQLSSIVNDYSTDFTVDYEVSNISNDLLSVKNIDPIISDHPCQVVYYHHEKFYCNYYKFSENN